MEKISKNMVCDGKCTNALWDSAVNIHLDSDK